MRHFILIAGLIGLSGLAREASALPGAGGLDWVQNPTNNHWYAYCSTPKAWYYAEKYANELGGHLAMPRAESENDFIGQQVAQGKAWIGVTDAWSEGSWCYPDREPVVYTNWCSGEPNNSNGGEDHVLINYCADSGWNDAVGSSAYPFVIEIAPDWIQDPVTGTWYTVTLVPMDWDDARDYAHSMGGEIASIHSPALNELLFVKFVSPLPPSNIYGCSSCSLAYIGLTDEVVEGQWVWVDGTLLDYLNWATGQPANAHHIDYAVLGWDTYGRWGAVRDEDLYALIQLDSSDCNGDGVPDQYELFVGLPIDQNDNGVHDSCELFANEYCFCEYPGSCGNSSDHSGCLNSTGAGAALIPHGTSSVSGDDLILEATSLRPDDWGLVYMGGAALGTPFALGDGLRCVGTGGKGLFRFSLRKSDQFGTSQLGPGIVAFSQGHFVSSGQIQSGDTWHFQAWYRDPGGPCGSTFNFSNAVEVKFVP